MDTWHDYLQFSIRPGCEPCFIMNNERRENAIVLVHGLTDSPYFMTAIGKYFYEQMGFNVFIPLLSGHGLKEPDGMMNVTLEQWKNNVKYAIETAKGYADVVSIGGLSTGGSLSFYQALASEDDISGGVFLFSAALHLTGKHGYLTGMWKELLLRLRIAKIIAVIQDRICSRNLVGENPYRYTYMDIHGAIQLERLIREIDIKRSNYVLSQPVFAAHSEADETADIETIKNLLGKCSHHELFIIPSNQEVKVAHASVVLQDDIAVLDEHGKLKVLEYKNPYFDKMMKTAHEFAINNLKNVQPLVRDKVYN